MPSNFKANFNITCDAYTSIIHIFVSSTVREQSISWYSSDTCMYHPFVAYRKSSVIRWKRTNWMTFGLQTKHWIRNTQYPYFCAFFSCLDIPMELNISCKKSLETKPSSCLKKSGSIPRCYITKKCRGYYQNASYSSNRKMHPSALQRSSKCKNPEQINSYKAGKHY